MAAFLLSFEKFSSHNLLTLSPLHTYAFVHISPRPLPYYVQPPLFRRFNQYTLPCRVSTPLNALL